MRLATPLSVMATRTSGPSSARTPLYIAAASAHQCGATADSRQASNQMVIGSLNSGRVWSSGAVTCSVVAEPRFPPGACRGLLHPT